MAVNSFKDLTLSFVVNGVEIACQLQEPQWVRPWAGEGSTTQLACGDILAEPAETPALGSISGNVLQDVTDAGVTKMLHEQLGNEVTLAIVETVESQPPGGTNRTVTYSGTVKVLPITRTWRSGRYSFHDLNLSWISEDAAPVFADVA